MMDKLPQQSCQRVGQRVECTYYLGHLGRHSFEEGQHNEVKVYDPVNPPHYKRGPTIKSPVLKHQSFILECIEILRHIKDPRLAIAFKYIWRVAFGGKVGVEEREDIKKAIWYLNDFVENEV